jgi:peptide deformylase
MSDFVIDTGVLMPVEKPLEPLPLYDENHPMLQREIPIYDLPLPNPNMSNLIKRMRMTMKKFGGIGLSANQCGVFERVFIIGTDDYELVCINPQILNSSEQINKSDEGCLSYPGLYLRIDRPMWLDVAFVNENGVVENRRLEGLTARCFAHELDHMNGKRFVDYVKPVALQQARRKQEKMMKKVVRNFKKK